jgi:hypothetical protein
MSYACNRTYVIVSSALQLNASLHKPVTPEDSYYTYTTSPPAPLYDSLRFALYQERAVFGKMKMDPAKRAQTQNAGEVSSLQWFFSQSVELMMDKV